jgi:hypothetical protein
VGAKGGSLAAGNNLGAAGKLMMKAVEDAN